MFALKKNQKAVSQIIGFVITFGIISMVTASLTYATSIIVERRENAASERIAENLANYIVNAILDCSAIKQVYPNSNCSLTIYVPNKINERTYYIEATASQIYVNLSNAISGSASTLKQENMCHGITGKVYPGNNELVIKSNSENFIYVIE